jgi:hypothetical protein
MAPIHLGVMPGRDVLARILGVSAKDVVSLDLLGLEELHRLVMLRKMDEAEFCPRRLGFRQQTTQGSLVHDPAGKGGLPFMH